MSIETDLYTALSGAAGVTSLVSTRIYPNRRPEGATKPAIEYSTIIGTRDSTLSGSGDPDHKMIQISCHADTYASAKSVAQAVYAALEGNGYQESEVDLYDWETQTHTVALTWRFMA